MSVFGQNLSRGRPQLEIRDARECPFAGLAEVQNPFQGSKADKTPYDLTWMLLAR